MKIKPGDVSRMLDAKDIEGLRAMERAIINKKRRTTHTPTHMISTVDLVMEHPGGMYAETLAFKTKQPGGEPATWGEDDGRRYHTFEEADAEHDEWVKRFGGKWEAPHA